MKITNFTSTVATSGATGRPAPTKPGGGSASTNVATSVTELRSQAVVGALASASDVDLDKVNQIRQAIIEGRLPLDPEKLAEAVLAVHRR